MWPPSVAQLAKMYNVKEKNIEQKDEEIQVTPNDAYKKEDEHAEKEEVLNILSDSEDPIVIKDKQGRIVDSFDTNDIMHETVEEDLMANSENPEEAEELKKILE